MSLAHLLTGDACSIGSLYSHPLVEAALGGSLHPGGTDLSLEMARIARIGPDDHVLDVGCGKGTSAAALAAATGCRVTGVDVSEDAIAEARARHTDERLTFQVLDGGDLAGLDGAFDAVLSECMLCLHGDPDETLHHFARLLRPDGRLMLSDVTVEAPAASFRSAAGFAACLGGALPAATLRETLQHRFDLEHWQERPELVGAVRDRIHDRIDVEAVLAVADVPGLRRLVAEAEAAWAAGHLGYAVAVGRPDKNGFES